MSRRSLHLGRRAMTRLRCGVFLCLGAVILLLPGACARGPEVREGTAAVNFRELLHFAQVYRSVRYDPSPDIDAAWGSFYQNLELVDLHKTANRYLIGTSDTLRRQEIFIRGTANVKNAFYDAKYRKHWNTRLGIHLHVGFEEMALAVYEDLLPRLHRDYDLYIFGHSLGAAEATIVGMLLDQDGFRVRRVIASGSPKLTDAPGAAKYAHLPVLRIVSSGDPIPRLPPPELTPLLRPYVHLGPEVLLLDGPFYACLEQRYRDGREEVPTWEHVVREKLAERLKGHLIAHYIERILPKLVEDIQVPYADRAAYLTVPTE
jgi:triacylglycerol lipase